ncbi:MAG: ATP-binding protein, partial [Myxococcota bacterium]
AVLQLVPGVAGVLFLKRLSATGVLAGLVTGLVAWGALLALPVVGFMGLQLPPWLTDGDALGVSALVAITLNALVTAALSRLAPASAMELRAAQLCRDEVESLAPGRRAASLEDLVGRVARVLGRSAARVEVERVTAELQLSRDTTDWAELRRVAERLETNLTGLVGPMLAHAALSAEGDDEDVPLAARLQLLEAEAQRGGAAAAQALREWLSNVFASLPVGVCVVSASGEAVWWNGSWTALLGTPADALSRLPAQGEFTHEGRTLNVSVASVTDPRLPGGRVLVLEDLTARRALERTVAHQERLASIGRLGAGVAHEIGNPLAGLLMVAQNLAREEQPVDLKERLGAIVEQGRRIDEIVKALVAFARREQQGPRQPRPVFLDAVVRDAVSLVSMTRKRPFEVEAEEGLAVLGVAGELVQVLVNLLSNAADASPADAPVRLTVRRSDDGVELKVIDTGVGMTAEVQARLFEPFFTTKEPGAGTGLGLSIVYSLVTAHGGRITVDSAPGRGTTVTIRLPGLVSR